MPITTKQPINVLTEPQFHDLAEKVIGIAFAIQNNFGRLLDEDVYKESLARRCLAAGLGSASREVQITVSHGTFTKHYFMDLLIASGLMMEGKTVQKLNASHEAQTLHYLLMTGMQHGLLLNFRPGKVEKRFVSTTLTYSEQRRLSILDGRWRVVNKVSEHLRSLLVDLVVDWGGFLQISLYREGIVHLMCDLGVSVRRIPIVEEGAQIGTHETLLLDNETALALTSLNTNQPSMQQHLQRFLSHTSLKYIQWINFNRHDIELVTINNVHSQ